jgi:hypothetical protein
MRDYGDDLVGLRDPDPSRQAWFRVTTRGHDAQAIRRERDGADTEQ